MQVFQTCGVPPSFGNIILPTMGCTRKRIKALTNNVMAKIGKATATTSTPRGAEHPARQKKDRAREALAASARWAKTSQLNTFGFSKKTMKVEKSGPTRGS